MKPLKSNEALERTAARRALPFQMIKTVQSKLRSLPVAVAQLGLVRW